MKIRITDLLDDYLDEDLPLDPIPEVGIQKSKRKSRPGAPHHSPRRAVQIAAGLVIVISLSAVAGMRLWCGGNTGASLAAGNAELYEQADAQPPSPEPVAEGDISAWPDGYETVSITSIEDQLSVTVSDVVQEGSRYRLTYTISTEIEHVTGFQLADAEVYLLLADDTIVTPTGSTETGSAENPFELRDVYEFSDLPEDAELDQAVLYVRIAQVTLTTTDGSIDVFGQWDVGFSGDNVLLDPAVPEETGTENTEALGDVGFSGDNVLLDPAVPEETGTENTEALGDAEFSVTDLEVSESGCSFWVHTKQDNYLMVPIGQLALVQESNPGTACYGISMVTDGNISPDNLTVSSSLMSTRGVTSTQNLVYCQVEWNGTIDPASILGMYFTDGTNSAQVEVYAYIY